MVQADAATLAQQMLKLGLVNELQLQEGWEAVGHKISDPIPLLRALEHLGYLTRFQSDKLLKEDTSGFVLGGYRLLYKIASGSFGRVYRADDPQTGRVVAIKVLRKRWSDDEHAIGLFEREGRVGLSLQHPNIVEVLAVSQDPVTNQYYIVMEFVEGGNLRQFLEIRKKLQPAEALRLIEDAVSGISHAYARGVTHRDMKLTNVLISSQGTAKLVDFGLAGIFSRKGLELDSGEKVDRTVDYAGLEKATGVKPGDVRSDIFFLGCILYEMLTGKPPLLMSRDPRVRMDPHRFARLEPMRPEDVTAPPSVFQLVERMMSLDPKLRYQTPSQLLDAVRSARRDIEVPPAETRLSRPPALPTVFVVERDEKLQNAVRNKFKELGYRVLLAADPARAVDRFRQQAYDALVLDAGTTGEEGRYIFERIVDEAERQGLSLRGILILRGEQAHWAKEIEPRDSVAVLVRPTLKQVYQKLLTLLPVLPKGSRNQSSGSEPELVPDSTDVGS
jgi:serine/threonine protein kinase